MTIQTSVCHVNEHGEILSISSMVDPKRAINHGHTLVDGTKYFHWDTSIDVGDVFEAARLYFWDDDLGRWMPRTECPSASHTWKNKQWEIDLDRLQMHVRQKRDELLKACDWTQFNDSPLSDADKGAWATYRQALRDISTQFSDSMTSADDITWPTAP